MASDPLNLTTIFSKVPPPLRNDLLNTFNATATNFRERRWEPAELNGGKLCEVVYTILKGSIEGQFATKSQKPRNFLDSCRKLEQAPSNNSRSVRIQVPRVLAALYEVRNNRSVGHIGGEVDPNEMDAAFVFHCAQWIMAELVRIFHEVSTDEATRVVEALTERELPLIWVSGATKRVLDTNLSSRDQTLVLAYTTDGDVDVEDLLKWIEYRNSSRFRKEILKELHRARLVEFDPNADTVRLTPLGCQYVEDHVILNR